MTDYEKLIEEFLNNWIECNKVCELGRTRERIIEDLSKADRYMEVLPGADYVLTQTLNYIFSNGLTTGSINQDKVLDKFLFKENERGTTNLDEIRNTIGMGITHGHSGLRWKDGNVYQYKWGTYRALTYLKGGIKKTVAYVVRTDGEFVPPIKFDHENYREYQDFLRDLNDNKLIFLTPSEFQNVRNDTSAIYGHSPLLADQERLDLLVAVYEQLNYDIRYDGPGRIVLRPKDGYVSGDDTDISTTELMNTALESQEKRIKALKQEIERIARDIRDSSSDSAIVISNAFDKEITHLPRVTKATEFFNWLKNDTMILAQDFGMSPSLLELGGVSGNVSMTSIIDNAMLNSIVPLRERYAVQISSFLARHLRVDKVYFNKYEMQQQEDENTMRTKIVNIMSLLNSMKDPEGNTRASALRLFDDFADMLSENIHNENNQLEKLSIGKIAEKLPVIELSEE